jgi:hypothetical protein
MHLRRLIFNLTIRLFLPFYCGWLFLFIAFYSYNFDFWVLASLTSIVLTGILFYACRSEKWRLNSLFPSVIILLSFCLFSPVRPFLSFFFSLDTGMTPSQVKTSLNHNFSAQPWFSLPREDSLRLSDEEQSSGISKFLYVVDPSDGAINCDMIAIEFDRENRLITASYSSLIIPKI